MKGWVLLAALIPLSAHADTVRITADGARQKYAGTVERIVPPSSPSAPAQLYFTQGSGLPIGGGPPAPKLPGSVRWTVVWRNDTAESAVVHCSGPVPDFDGTEFHFHLICDRQP
jgi:hypothetical protein